MTAVMAFLGLWLNQRKIENEEAAHSFYYRAFHYRVRPIPDYNNPFLPAYPNLWYTCRRAAPDTALTTLNPPR
jgi:hypothetical protein